MVPEFPQDFVYMPIFPLHSRKLWKTNMKPEHHLFEKETIIFQNLHLFAVQTAISFSALAYILYTRSFFSIPKVFHKFRGKIQTNQPQSLCLNEIFTGPMLGYFPAVQIISRPLPWALPDLICHHLWIQPSVWNGGV